MSDLTKHQQAAQDMLDAIDTFMSGEGLTKSQTETAQAVTKAGCYSVAAYEAYQPKSGGECHAMTRAFLLALIDPLSPELDYLRMEPAAGEKAREERRESAH